MRTTTYTHTSHAAITYTASTKPEIHLSFFFFAFSPHQQPNTPHRYKYGGGYREYKKTDILFEL